MRKARHGGGPIEETPRMPDYQYIFKMPKGDPKAQERESEAAANRRRAAGRDGKVPFGLHGTPPMPSKPTLRGDEFAPDPRGKKTRKAKKNKHEKDKERAMIQKSTFSNEDEANHFIKSFGLSTMFSAVLATEIEKQAFDVPLGSWICLHSGLRKADKPPAGFQSVQGSKKGGYKKMIGGKWVYWYPGQPHPKAARSEAKESSTKTKAPKEERSPQEEAQAYLDKFDGNAYAALDEVRELKKLNPKGLAAVEKILMTKMRSDEEKEEPVVKLWNEMADKMKTAMDAVRGSEEDEKRYKDLSATARNPTGAAFMGSEDRAWLSEYKARLHEAREKVLSDYSRKFFGLYGPGKPYGQLLETKKSIEAAPYLDPKELDKMKGLLREHKDRVRDLIGYSMRAGDVFAIPKGMNIPPMKVVVVDVQTPKGSTDARVIRVMDEEGRPWTIARDRDRRQGTMIHEGRWYMRPRHAITVGSLGRNGLTTPKGNMTDREVFGLGGPMRPHDNGMIPVSPDALARTRKVVEEQLPKMRADAQKSIEISEKNRLMEEEDARRADEERQAKQKAASSIRENATSSPYKGARDSARYDKGVEWAASKIQGDPKRLMAVAAKKAGVDWDGKDPVEGAKRVEAKDPFWRGVFGAAMAYDKTPQAKEAKQETAAVVGDGASVFETAFGKKPKSADDKEKVDRFASGRSWAKNKGITPSSAAKIAANKLGKLKGSGDEAVAEAFKKDPFWAGVLHHSMKKGVPPGTIFLL